jgi:hypothetical protein
MGVRLAEARDAAEIGGMFQDVFRAKGVAPPRTLVDYLSRLYLAEGKSASLVHVGHDGRLDGFMGIALAQMTLDGTPLRVGVTGCYMAASRERSGRAGLALYRAARSMGLDLYISDTANQITAQVAIAHGSKLLADHSLEWMRLLHVGRLAADMTERRFGAAAGAGARLLAPAIDAAGRLAVRPLEAKGAAATREIDAATFLERAEPHFARYRLRPAWTRESGLALMALASEKRRNGPLRFFETVVAGGRAPGCFALYLERGRVSLLLEALAEPRQMEATLRAAMLIAQSEGASAIRGATRPSLTPALFPIPGVLYRHNAATFIHVKRPDVIAAIGAGEALLGGFVGEGWSRLISDAF